MGYSHYWCPPNGKTPLKPFPPQLLADIKQVIKYHRAILCFEYDEPKRAPKVTSTYVRFNGRDDDGHETFIFDVNFEFKHCSLDRENFTFCKTARKPYDIAVCKILLLLAAHYGGDLLGLSSDGFSQGEDDDHVVCFEAEWIAAIEWVRSLGRYDLRKALPKTVSDESVETPLTYDQYVAKVRSKRQVALRFTVASLDEFAPEAMQCTDSIGRMLQVAVANSTALEAINTALFEKGFEIVDVAVEA